MKSWLKHKVVLIVGLLLLCGGVAFYIWRESPDQKVPRLLREMRDLPHGEFEIFYFGRSYDQIQADFDRLGPRAVPGLIEGLTTHTRRYVTSQRASSEEFVIGAQWSLCSPR